MTKKTPRRRPRKTSTLATLAAAASLAITAAASLTTAIHLAAAPTPAVTRAALRAWKPREKLSEAALRAHLGRIAIGTRHDVDRCRRPPCAGAAQRSPS